MTGRVRITGGNARGRTIEVPPGLIVRPTAAKIRQAFFNILMAQVPDSRFLDLFAGAGLMGIEALSRGASELVAVDESKSSVKIIESNLKAVGFKAEVIAADVRRVLPVMEGERFDIIFADPPYKTSLALTVVQAVDRHQLLSEEGVLAIEHDRALRLPEQTDNLVSYDRREYGQTAITFYRQRVIE